MQLNKELEKLRADKAKAEKELEYLQHDMQRLQNRVGYLEKGERQKRAHRLITKGAAIECLAPATKEMSGLGVEFCVSDIRQSQEWRCRNRAESG
jgi:uncharacterized protein YlxW (UPF0749 family)